MKRDDIESRIHGYISEQLGSEVIDARGLSQFKETREAEDLHGILRDLEFTKGAIETLHDMMEDSDQEGASPSNAHIIQRSLYTAALIAYARCYGKPKRNPSGKRTLLYADQVFVDDATDWRRHHDHFINVRDKHLAHSVNSFEINQAGLFVENWATDPPQHYVGILSFHRESETSGNILALARLAEIAMDHTYDRSDVLLERLHEQVSALPISARRTLEPMEVEFRQGPTDVSGPRQ